MNSSFLNKRLTVQSYKHDGSMHRIWSNLFEVIKNEDYIVVAGNNIEVIEHNFHFWKEKEPTIMIFFFKLRYNVSASIKNEKIKYYVNLASPSLQNKNIIKYVDYDLDIKLFPDRLIKVVDEKEYLKHKVLYGYNDDIDHILQYNLNEIKKKMINKEFPFIDSEIKKLYNNYLEKYEKENYGSKIN